MAHKVNAVTRLDNIIQHGFMRRRGIRGRWLTIYLHRYGGKAEATERFHSHPWRLAIGVQLRGVMDEDRQGQWWRPRAAPSIAFYRQSDRHRVRSATGWTLFVGLLRTQRRMENATCCTKHGWAHYSELTASELPMLAPPYAGDLVECRR